LELVAGDAAAVVQLLDRELLAANHLLAVAGVGAGDGAGGADLDRALLLRPAAARRRRRGRPGRVADPVADPSADHEPRGAGAGGALQEALAAHPPASA